MLKLTQMQVGSGKTANRDAAEVAPCSLDRFKSTRQQRNQNLESEHGDHVAIIDFQRV